MKREIQNKRGSAIILLAISMTAIIGFAALAADVGLMTYNKSKLQNAVDAAALAGAHEIPEDTSLGEIVAEDYLDKNGENVGSLADCDISFEESDKKIVVEATYKVDFFFAKVIGKDSANVTVRAAAINAPVKKVVSGLRPFAVLEEDTEKEGLVTLKVGDKKNADKDDKLGPGNFGAVGLEQDGKDTGANVYRDNIHFGTTGSYWIGKKIDTETGNMAGPTEQGLADLFAAEGDVVVVYVPVVDTLYVNGKKSITIVGFASFELKKSENTVKDEVRGRFVDFVTPGVADPDGEDYGLRAVNLVE